MGDSAGEVGRRPSCFRRRRLAMWVAVGLLGGPLANVVHESSHAVCVVAGGGELVAFRPWPHRASSDGRWLTGSVSQRGTSEPWRSRSHVAPLVESLALVALWGLLGLRWRVLWLLAAWELLDVGNWLRGWLGWGAAGMDGARWRAR